MTIEVRISSPKLLAPDMIRAMGKHKHGDGEFIDYEFPGQHPGEKVRVVFHQHPIVMRHSLLLGLALLTVFALPLSIWPLERWPWWSFLIGFIAMLLIFGYRFIGYYFSVYILTSERLIQIVQKGFFNRRVVDIGLNKIQSVNYEIKGLQATMFGFGTITVQTYVGDLDLKFIHHPVDIHQMVVKQIRDQKPAGPVEDLGPLAEAS